MKRTIKRVLSVFMAIVIALGIAPFVGERVEAADDQYRYAPHNGGSECIGLDVGCTISENCSWISVTRTSATTAYINIAPNTSYQSRKDVVTIMKGNKVVKRYYIVQDQRTDTLLKLLSSLNSVPAGNGKVIAWVAEMTYKILSVLSK